MAFISTVAFSCLFNVPREELVYIGAVGALGWLCFQICVYSSANAELATFLATVAVAWTMRVLTPFRRMPTTVFLIGGIIPFVPGAGIYNTMYALITDEPASAVATGVETMKTFGIICIAVIIVLSLPKQMFVFKRRKK
jgi:uncharacterized membrane protein YjjB (DUF3815 family)